VKVDVVIVAGFIAVLNVIAIFLFRLTPVALLSGSVELASTPIVVNFQTLSAAIATPAAFLKPVVTVAVYSVPASRGDVGVKVAIVPEYDTVPATGVEPLDRVNVAAVAVDAFIADVKDAMMVELSATPTALAAGVVPLTDGVVGAGSLLSFLQPNTTNNDARTSSLMFPENFIFVFV